MARRKQGLRTGKAFILTGTDTGVGKTLVACALAAEFRRQGLHVGVMKPVETGVTGPPETARPHDALLLKRFSGSRFPIHVICPYRFKAPLAPWVAAGLEKRRIDLGRLRAVARSIIRSHDITIIETAGGLLVPLTRRRSYLDFALSLDLPIIVVARLGLGTLNHTLLTIRAAQSADARVLGVILNDTVGGREPAERHNPATLAHLTTTPILGIFPHLRGVQSPSRLAAAARRSLDRRAILDEL